MELYAFKFLLNVKQLHVTLIFKYVYVEIGSCNKYAILVVAAKLCMHHESPCSFCSIHFLIYCRLQSEINISFLLFCSEGV